MMYEPCRTHLPASPRSCPSGGVGQAPAVASWNLPHIDFATEEIDAARARYESLVARARRDAEWGLVAFLALVLAAGCAGSRPQGSAPRGPDAPTPRSSNLSDDALFAIASRPIRGTEVGMGFIAGRHHGAFRIVEYDIDVDRCAAAGGWFALHSGCEAQGICTVSQTECTAADASIPPLLLHRGGGPRLVRRQDAMATANDSDRPVRATQRSQLTSRANGAPLAGAPGATSRLPCTDPAGSLDHDLETPRAACEIHGPTCTCPG
jgi:hypothetical protein